MPSGLSEGGVSVRLENPDGLWAVKSGALYIEDDPTVTGVSPGTVYPGETVSVTGTGFVAGSAVTFDSTGSISKGIEKRSHEFFNDSTSC